MRVPSLRARALTLGTAVALLWNATAIGAGGTNGGAAWNMEVVGHDSLGGRGYNADVWFHDGFAYVGSWGFPDWAAAKHDRFCPSSAGNGIAVVDATNPANPEFVARLIPPAKTSSEDVVVYTAAFGPLAGHDIAAVGIQTCGAGGYDLTIERGLQLFDVTDAAHPVQIGFWDSECCARGVHELEVANRADLGRTFAYLSVPGSRDPDPNHASGYKDEDGDGDFRLVDITDPTAPVQTSEWGIQDAGGPFSPGLGCEPDENYGHSAEPSADGRTAFFAQWDGGFFRLDLTNPASPVFEGRSRYPANADGQAHSSQWDEGRELLFGNDEDFCKTATSDTEKGYGYMRIYDWSDPAHPVQIGAYKTPNAGGSVDPAGGDFSIHNNWLVGTDVYSSWYSDGVRVIDASDPTRPVEVAYFVPPAAQNPIKPSQRGTLSNKPQVWGVVVDEATGLIYASDMNSGLWILRRTD